MAFIVVEKTYADPSFENLARESGRVTRCLEARGVRWVHSYFSPDRRRAFCVYEAADAEAVRQAYRSADTAFDSIWVGTRLGE